MVERYTAGMDHVFDVRLLPFDVEASRAHAKGLCKIGILTRKELKDLLAGLDALMKAYEAGKIVIRPEDEDCHTVIENFLVKKIGAAGKKIHTGRSRNDQVAVAMRLYMKHHLDCIGGAAKVVAQQCAERAGRFAKVPMPGYSHTQQAMLTTLGHYFGAYAESLVDDIEFLETTHDHLDKNPLGTAAGFGTAIPIDREFTTRELGFAKMQINSMYVQNSRGKYESLYLEALTQVMMSLGRFANDMLLFTSQEFAYFKASDRITTGSSIMPHKRNLDPLEVMRGNVSVVIGNQLMVRDIAKNLLSGYNRDGQLIKKPVMESTAIVEDSLAVAGIVLDELAPDVERIRNMIDMRIFTADKANELVVKEGMPFRDAYKKAADFNPERVDLLANITSKKTIGAPGNLALGLLKKRLAKY